MGDGSRPENGRAMSLESSTLSPSAPCALGRSAKAPVFQTGKAGSTPAGHSRGSANGRPAVFEAAHEGSTPGMWVLLENNSFRPALRENWDYPVFSGGSPSCPPFVSANVIGRVIRRS